MGSQRLKELERQKKLLLEHLEWLNLEIDQEATKSAPPSSPHANRLAGTIPDEKPVTPSLELESKPQEQVASDVYDQLGPDAKNAAADARKGCLLIGAAAFATFAAIAIYVSFYY